MNVLYSIGMCVVLLLMYAYFTWALYIYIYIGQREAFELFANILVKRIPQTAIAVKPLLSQPKFMI